MYYVVKRDSDLHWCSDLNTTVSEEILLIGDDGSEVSIPIILLLAASPVIRSMVANVVIISPLALSITGVSRDALLCLCQILSSGEVNVENDNGEEVKMALKMLGVEVSLSCFQIKNFGPDNMNDDDDQDKNENIVEGNSVKKEVKLEIFVKPDEYVDLKVSGNNVEREYGEYIERGFESTFETGKVKAETASISEWKEIFGVIETEKKNNYLIKDEHHENGYEKTNTKLMKRKRSRSVERNSNRNQKKSKRNNLCASVDIHWSVNCNGCAVEPIKGERYRCTVCKNFDLCGSCKKNGTHSDTEHTMNMVSLYKCKICGFRSSKRGFCNTCKEEGDDCTFEL